MERKSIAAAVAGIVAALTLVLAGTAHAELYVIEVRRVEQDLYKTSNGVYIQTRYCYVYAYGEKAVLRYEPCSYDNILIFDNDDTCDVVKVFK